MRFRRRHALVLALPLGAAAAAPGTPETPAIEGVAMVSLDAKQPAALRNRPGDVSRTQAGYELIARGPLNGTDFMALDYEFKYTDNRFHGAAAPYGDTQSHFLGAKYNRMTDARHGFGVVGGAELAAENEADLLGDGRRGGIGPTVLWNPSAKFTTETGVTVQTQFGRPATVSPYVKWVYTPGAAAEFEVRATGLQNGLLGTWFITENKATSLRLSLMYETMQYALRDGAPARGVITGEVPLRATLTQFLSPHLFVAVRAEAVLWHREEFYRDDRRLDRVETQPATTLGLLMGARF